MKDAKYKAQISFELSLLLADQSEFFEKSALVEPTSSELEQFQDNIDRIRDLFAELEQLSRAA
jgi:hypothetical protein